MKKSFGVFVLAAVLGLGLTQAASAQSVWDGIFGRKPAPAPVQPRENDQRLIEILVELAWLSDAATFPFFIEARVEQQALHVRGNVPSRAVRDLALRLAQRSTSLPVIDELKENPKLRPHPTHMSPEQLQNSVRAALRESMPRQAKNLQTRCSADGQVAVSGTIESFEQKLQISQALRRLHGCTAALNMTRVAYDPDGKLARAAKTSLPPAQANVAMVPGGQPTGLTAPPTSPFTSSPLPRDVNSSPLAGSTPPPQIVINTEPPLAGGAIPNVPNGAYPSGVPSTPGTVPYVQPPQTNQQAPRLSAAQVQKRIQDACSRATKVVVTMKPTGEFRVDIHLRDDNDFQPVFDRVNNLPELEGCRLDLNFFIGSPGKM